MGAIERYESAYNDRTYCSLQLPNIFVCKRAADGGAVDFLDFELDDPESGVRPLCDAAQLARDSVVTEARNRVQVLQIGQASPNPKTQTRLQYADRGNRSSLRQ